MFCIKLFNGIFLQDECFINPPGEGGGDFDRDARVTFLYLKLYKLLFFGVAQNEGYFRE